MAGTSQTMTDSRGAEAVSVEYVSGQKAQTRLSGLALVLLAVLAYVTLHGGFRLLASASLGEDDPLESLLVQDLLLGYRAPQPPLYDWVLWCVQRVTGPGILGFLLIKYGALLATAGFLYSTAERVLKDRVWAMLAVESMALIYQIAWRYHEGFTHGVGAMVAVAATLWAFVRFLTLGRTRDVVVLGFTAGLGLLTELTYAVFLTSLVIAAALQPSIRARLWQPRLLVAAGLAALVASPWVYWIVTTPGPLSWVTRHTPSFAGNLGKGLIDAVRGPFFYLSPLIVFLPLVFRGFFGTALGDLRRAPNAGREPDFEQLVLHQAMVAVGLSVGGAVLLGASGYAMHRLMPLYLPAVIWLMGVARRGSETALPRARFARLALMIALIALSARLANMFVYDPVCKICRWGIPYAGLAAELQKRGFKPGPQSVVVVAEPELGGNLRVSLGATRILAAGETELGDTFKSAPPKQVAIVWTASHPEVKPALQAVAQPLLPGGVHLERAEPVRVPWKHLWRPTGYRQTEWHVLIGPATQK